MLAELRIYYDLQERLVRLLESAMDELLFDVICLPTEHLDAQLASRVALASDMVRPHVGGDRADLASGEEGRGCRGF